MTTRQFLKKLSALLFLGRPRLKWHGPPELTVPTPCYSIHVTIDIDYDHPVTGKNVSEIETKVGALLDSNPDAFDLLDNKSIGSWYRADGLPWKGAYK